MVGDGIRQALTVTGEAAALSEDESLAQAGADYQRYVQSQTAALLEQTTAFVDAVKAGDIAGAKALYPVARTYWERIEPVAESFGDLDPLIDGREGDQEPRARTSPASTASRRRCGRPATSATWGPTPTSCWPTCRRSSTRAERGRRSTPLQLANGAKALLDEIATGKITGEEDRYSHTDLWDFAGQPRRARRPPSRRCGRSCEENDADLVAEIDERFAATEAELEQHRAGDGWMLYDQLTEAAAARPERQHHRADRVGQQGRRGRRRPMSEP